MIAMLAGLVGRLSGPVLVYVLLGLVVANATTGYLLKRAWDDNARAQLECENAALRDANVAREAVAAELEQVRISLALSEKKRKQQGREAEKEIAAAVREKEIEHADAIANMEFATNEIADDEFFCASEPVATDQLNRMRFAAASYNKARNRASASTDTD